MGLLVRIFRSILSRRVVEGRLGRVEAAVVEEEIAPSWLVRAVGIEEVIDIEFRAIDRRDGVVINQIIEVRIAGLGGIEIPALKNKAIWVNGRQHAEITVEESMRSKVVW